MKKFYYISTLTVCSLFWSSNVSMSQTGCNLALIRSTFTGAGCTELASCLSSCSMYFYNPISQTGSAAQAWAQNYGANLISIQSASENACIVTALNNNVFGGVIWIGFNDEAIEGTFVWYDQSAVVYTNWNGGEPNNSGGNEDCTQIYPNNGRWNDLPCTSSSSKSVIEVNLCPVITITPSATTICAGQNATCTASTILGSAPYTYSWTSNPAGFTSTSASPAVTPSVTTTYNVTATDRYGCTSSQSVVITVNPLPTATISGTATVCRNAAAPITFTGATGTAPYTFTYTINGGTNQTVSTTGGGSVVTVAASTTATGTFIYSLVSVRESSSTTCSQLQSGSATITVKPLPTATIAGTTVICQNDANVPDITFTGAGGTVPYTFNYSINGGAQTVSTTGGSNVVTVPASTTTPGTYMYDLSSVSDNNTCSQSQSGMVTITVNPLPTAIIAGTTAVCEGASAPNITLTGAAGTAPYTLTYTINSGTNQTVSTTGGNSVTLPVSTSTAGTFLYVLAGVQDANSPACYQSQSGSATVTVNPLPTATIAGTTALCKGAASPNITFTGAAGTAPYTFTYKINGGTNQTVSTTGGNSAVTVPVPTSIAGTFIYSLVSVQDASSTTCSKSVSGSATVTVNPLPTATITGTTALCVDATAPNITFTGANGSAPYTFNYVIPGGTNQTISTNSGNSVTISVPTATSGAFTYSLSSVQDASSTTCSQTQSGTATVTVNPLPTATIAGTTAVCAGTTAPGIIFTGAGSTAPYTFTYTINGGSNQTMSTTGGNSTVSVSAPTTVAGIFIYALVSVRDASSTLCSQNVSGSATVTVNPLPTAIIAGTTAVCNNDPAPNITFTGAAGTAPYTITYTINSGANQTITTIGNIATVSVPTGTAGAYTYSLVSIKDASSTTCSQTQNGTATVTVNPLPIAMIAGTIAVCENDATPNITFSGAGGTAPYTIIYTINGGTNQTAITATGDIATIAVSTSTAGIFIYNLVSVQDASSTTCSQLQSGSATVTVNPLPTASIAGTAAVCKNAIAPNITFTGAVGTAPYTFTYAINSGTNQTVNTTNGNSVTVPVPSGTVGIYTYALVSVQDASLTTCSQAQSGSATVTVNPLPTATIAGTTTVCKNAIAPNVTFSGAAGTMPYTFTYKINGGTNQTVSTTNNNSAVTLPAPTTTAGTFVYTLVSVQDASSTTCSQTQNGTAVIKVNPLPTASISGTTSVCKNATAPNITFTGAASTAPYTFTYTINGGSNQTISTISGNSTTVSVPTAALGTYTYSLVSVQDASSTACSQTQNGSVIITVNPNPVVLFGANPKTGCEPLCVNFIDSSSIAAGNNAQWLWSFGDGSPASNLQNDVFHCYTNDSVFSPLSFTPTLTVTSDSGCVSTLSKNDYITVYPKPNAGFRALPDIATMMDPVISIINLSVGADFWNWNFGDGDTSSAFNPAPHPYADSGKYIVTLIASTLHSCLDTAYQTIMIEPDFAFFIPGAFSPNDDGINDTFSGKGIFISKYQMVIYDRWGNLIFFTDNINKSWDGKANYGTQTAQADVYVYSIKLTDINKKQHAYKGIVKLVR